MLLRAFARLCAASGRRERKANQSGAVLFWWRVRGEQVQPLPPGAVSQHLARLKQAGLVESQRAGNRVYYRHTPRGKALVELF